MIPGATTLIIDEFILRFYLSVAILQTVNNLSTYVYSKRLSHYPGSNQSER